MIEMAQHNYIRFLHYNKGWSIRAIARHCKLHRNTVKRAIQNDSAAYVRKVPKPKPVNGDFLERIQNKLEENWKAKKEDQLTKFRMYTLLKDEGYPGSYEAFTWQTRQIEQEQGHAKKEAFLKLIALQSHLQVDFGEIQLVDQGVPRKMFFFCCKLAWSKVEFVQLYPRCSTEYFFEGLSEAFIFYGGIPRHIVFDNLTPAVKQILPGEERVLQDSFLRFQSYHCFEARFCAGGKGNQKGRVERLVLYIKDNYFKPKPVFTGFASMNEKLKQQCKQRMQSQLLEGRLWEELLLEDQAQFLPLREKYECARILEAKVDTYQLVHLECNRYSVPTPYVGQRVMVKCYPFEVVIVQKDQVIARHHRLFGKNHEHLDPYHFLSLLEKKTRAYDEAKVIHDWNLPPCYAQYHRSLQAKVMSKSKGTREFIAILRLTETYGVEAIAKLLRSLAKDFRFSYQEVLSCLREQQEIKIQALPLAKEVLATYGLESYHWEKPSLQEYTCLLDSGREEAS